MCIEMHSMKIMVIERLRLCPWTPLFFVEPFNFLPERKSFYFWCEMFRHWLEIWFGSVWVFDTLMLREQTKANIFFPKIQSFIPFLSLFYGYFFSPEITRQNFLFFVRPFVCIVQSKSASFIIHNEFSWTNSSYKHSRNYLIQNRVENNTIVFSNVKFKDVLTILRVIIKRRALNCDCLYWPKWKKNPIAKWFPVTTS